MRPSHLDGLIDKFAIDLDGKTEIDMVCLSHFDGDHVSGLDLLLKKFTIDTLVIPYVPLETRLRIASEIVEEQVANAGYTAALMLDPVTYLEQRGMSERISRIALIRGRSPRDENEFGPQVPTNPEDNFRETGLTDKVQNLRLPRGHGLTDSAGYGSSSIALRKHTRLYMHDVAWNVGDAYEFAFYNKAWPENLAPRSDSSLEQVSEEIRELIDLYSVIKSGTPKSGWLSALKDLYRKHFGNSYRRKNEISLCVYGRPAIGRSASRCNIFKDVYGDQEPIEEIHLELQDEEKNGILLTGDSYLNGSDLSALMTHLTSERWEKLCVMQVPHHGSRNNWAVGNSTQCKSAYYVICAPGTKNHPSNDVLNDLPGHAIADYGNAISFDIHDA
jgi:beta-lactamase superfamily II metal-dependent hydrolase